MRTDRGERRRYPPELVLGLAIVGIGCAFLVVDQVPAVPGTPASSDAADSEAPEAPDEAAGPESAAPSPSSSASTPETAVPSASASPPASPSESPSPSPSGAEDPAILASVADPVDSADGELAAVSGSSDRAGDGPVQKYRVEVEKGLPDDPEDFAAAVDAILPDERGWGDGLSFERTGDADAAVDFTVKLASPDTTDALCAPLSTNGFTSCTSGGSVIINQNRWTEGVEDFGGDLETYRIYVINHEVGHALGHGHVNCPGDGEPAPVMQQQTLSLDGCKPNGWNTP
ncbi:DUF3152 domain-containing protein [Nocardiopsis coralliicola]